MPGCPKKQFSVSDGLVGSSSKASKQVSYDISTSQMIVCAMKQHPATTVPMMPMFCASALSFTCAPPSPRHHQPLPRQHQPSPRQIAAAVDACDAPSCP